MAMHKKETYTFSFFCIAVFWSSSVHKTLTQHIYIEIVVIWFVWLLSDKPSYLPHGNSYGVYIVTCIPPETLQNTLVQHLPNAERLHILIQTFFEMLKRTIITFPAVKTLGEKPTYSVFTSFCWDKLCSHISYMNFVEHENVILSLTVAKKHTTYILIINMEQVSITEEVMFHWIPCT